MTFLTTPYLWLGFAAAALPVIIHLIRRAKVQVVPFAAMRFLQATSPRVIRRQKLKQIFLLLLRILALLLLGLAFARPFFQGEAPVSVFASSQRSIGIVVDASASMLAGANSDRARAAAANLIRQARHGDRFSIVAAGATPRILLEDSDAAQARLAITAWQPRLELGNLREAVLTVDNLLRKQLAGGNRHAELHVISDLQLSNCPIDVVMLSSDAKSYVNEAGSSWQNVAVMDGTLDAAPACRVKNFSSTPQTIEVSLTSMAGKTLARQSLVVRAGEERVAQFSEPAAKIGSGFFEARTAVDDFPADNRYFVAPSGLSARRALAVTDRSESLFFVRQAFAVSGSVPFRLTEIKPEQLARVALNDFECILVAASAGLTRDAVARVKDYVREGGGLLVAPMPGQTASGASADGTIGVYNLLLAEMMPAKLQRPIFSSVDRNRSRRFADIDFHHPIFALFADPAHGDPGRARFFQYFGTAPTGSRSSTLAAFDDGHAALLETSFGKGKTLLWTAGLDAQWSDLALKPIFLPLLYEMMEYLSKPRPKSESLRIGQPIFLDGFAGGETMKVILPNGAEEEISGAANSYSATEQAGLYRFRQRGRETSFAVNLDRHESDPQSLAPEDFLARLSRSGNQAPVAGVFGHDETSELDNERSQKLWRLALLALLLVLLTEGWLAKTTPR